MNSLDSADNNYYPDSYTQERQGLFLKRVLCNECRQTIIQDTTVIWNSSCGSINEVPTLQTRGQSLKIFPNPGSGKFTLQYQITGNTTVEIDNVLGKKVETKELKSNTEEFDFSAQPAGVYFIFITSGNQITTGKIVLEK